jgi:hypothetical protein
MCTVTHGAGTGGLKSSGDFYGTKKIQTPICCSYPQANLTARQLGPSIQGVLLWGSSKIRSLQVQGNVPYPKCSRPPSSLSAL